MSDLFVENNSVPDEPVKKPRKKRAPMSEEKKAEFSARMKASREKKKLEREQAKAEKEKPKAVAKEKVEKVVKEEKVEKVVPAKQKKERVLRHVPNELDIHNHEIQCLKNELLVLKRNKKNNKDMEEVRALKEELKELRDLAKAYKQSQMAKDAPVKENVKVQIQEPVKEKKVEPPTCAPAKQKVVSMPTNKLPPKLTPRYSTYQKSIWAQFT